MAKKLYYFYFNLFCCFFFCIQEGQELIVDFTNKCKALDNSLSYDELTSKISSFKEEIIAKNNPYVNALMST